MYLACLLATLAAFPQDKPHEPTMLERIDALIAKTNAYEGFIARYRGFDTEGHELTMRVVFRAPREILIDVQGNESRFFTRTRGQALDQGALRGKSDSVRSSIEDANSVDRYDARVRAQFEKQFPGVLRPDELPRHDKIFVGLGPSLQGDYPMLNSGNGTTTLARLQWLDDIHSQPELASFDHDGAKEIVYSRPDGIRVFISPETGFMTRIERQTDAGVRRGLDLISLETGSKPPDSEFELPAPSEGVRDDSNELRVDEDDRGFFASRTHLFSTLAHMLDDGRLKWTDESPARIEDVLRGLHQMHSGLDLAGEVSIGVRFLDEKVVSALRDWLRDKDLSDPQTQAVGSEWVRKAREDMETQLRKLGEEFYSGEQLKGTCKQPLTGTCKVRPSLYDDLAAMEKHIQPWLYSEGVIKPLLAQFDEKVGKQLQAK